MEVTTEDHQLHSALTNVGLSVQEIEIPLTQHYMAMEHMHNQDENNINLLMIPSDRLEEAVVLRIGTLLQIQAAPIAR